VARQVELLLLSMALVLPVKDPSIRTELDSNSPDESDYELLSFCSAPEFAAGRIEGVVSVIWNLRAGGFQIQVTWLT
jgi:hypothetical protein